MSAYSEIQQRVMNLIKEPLPNTVQESYREMRHVTRDALAELSLPVRAVEIPGWDKFNYYTGGLREREFTVLCGPTGAGKTTFLANMAVQLTTSLVPIFVASVETGSNDFMRKMISIVTGIDTGSGRTMTKEEVVQIKQTVGTMFNSGNSVFSNYDSRVPHIQLLCDLLHAVEEKGVKVALIDNLNFITDISDERNANSKMDKAIHDFVVFCKKVPIHVIMVMHPRKTEDGRIEHENDIKGSSTAVQESSNVLLWNRLHKDEEAPYNPNEATKYEHGYCREIKFAKARKRGRSVGRKVIFALHGLGERMREISN